MSYVHHTILVVDPNPDDAHFTQLALQRVGVITPVQIVSDAEQAIAYLSCQGEFATPESCPVPVLILLELDLPNRSGLEFLEWLRRRPVLKRLPVIVLTSSRDPESLNRAYELGCNSYLVKPNAFNALLVLMQGFVHYWLSMNQGAELSLAVDPSAQVDPHATGAAGQEPV
jgi:CheY-like chemotaxis protein